MDRAPHRIVHFRVSIGSWRSSGYFAEPPADPEANSSRMVRTRMSEMMSVMGELRFDDCAGVCHWLFAIGTIPSVQQVQQRFEGSF